MPVQTDLPPEQTDLDDAAELPAGPDGGTDDDIAAVATRSANEESPALAAAVPLQRKINWRRAFVYGFLPALTLVLAITAGVWKWLDTSRRDTQIARIESAQAARESTIAMLSYQPDTVEKDLTGVQTRLNGSFRDAYAKLIRDVVIPGSKQKRISAIANVVAAAPVSATPDHAVVLVFVDQTSSVGNDPPTDTASSVRVTLDKVGERWLISDFTPV